jgi:hypothetical protein
MGLAPLLVEEIWLGRQLLENEEVSAPASA